MATDEFIAVDDVVTSPRGRKPELDADLMALLSKLPAGQAVRLGGTFGEVARDDRQTVSANIRKHWRALNRKDGAQCRIDYTPQGVPQVRAKASK